MNQEAISEPDFTYVSSLVHADSAIVLDAGKEYLVVSRLGSLAVSEGCSSLAELVSRLRTAEQPELRRKIVEALTTNETSFFRDLEPFELLRKSIIPALVETRQIAKTLTIWCAACSTGQEPYSIAMMIRENFPQLIDWKIRIIATDLAQEILNKAKTGTFSQLEVNRGLPVNYMVKYFQRNGTEWKIKDEIRNLIDFRELNLIKPWVGIPPCDVIFMRNVLIYFDIPTKKAIFAKVRSQLRSDGYFFLGTAETTLNIDDTFKRYSQSKGSCYTLGGV